MKRVKQNIGGRIGILARVLRAWDCTMHRLAMWVLTGKIRRDYRRIKSED